MADARSGLLCWQNLLALLAGVLLPLSLAPFGLWWLGPGSVLALLVALHGPAFNNPGTRTGTLRVYLYSVAAYGVGISWIYVSISEHGGAGPVLASSLVAAFVLAISLVPAALGYLYLRLEPVGAWRILACFPAFWFFREWVMTWLLTGFPWLFVGYGQLETPFAAWAPVAGVLGMGYLVALFATCLYLLLFSVGLKARLVPGAVILVLALLTAGLTGKDWVQPSGEVLDITLVQGNIPQETKWRRESVVPIMNVYRDLSEPAWGRDLVIWPEAAITLFREQAGSLLRGLDQRGRIDGTTLVLGIPDRNAEGGFLNTAVAVGQGEGQYIKHRLVPFGEYVPLESLLRGLIGFFDLPMSRNVPGPAGQAPLRAGDVQVGMSICYEVVYPDLVRRSGADLLVTISNDTWFGDSIGPWQHFEMARMRALENGRPLARATNNGVTALVAADGSVVTSLPRFERGVLNGQLALQEGTTPYSNLGDFPLLTVLLLWSAGLLTWKLRGASGTAGARGSGP